MRDRAELMSRVALIVGEYKGDPERAHLMEDDLMLELATEFFPAWVRGALEPLRADGIERWYA